MSVNNIKTGVVSSLISYPIEDNTDKLILGCLLYEYTENILAAEEKLQNNIRNVVDTYAPSFIKKLNELKISFVSYDLMRARIESFRKTNFLALTLKEIRQINVLYRDKTQIKPFSINYFSQYMYKIINVSDYYYKKLSETHFNIMVPIVKFCMDTYGVADYDMEILSSLNYADKPGKDITFRVKGVDSATIITNIKQYKIPLKSPDDFYSIKVNGNYVRLITN
jgi:hypothetical protein